MFERFAKQLIRSCNVTEVDRESCSVTRACRDYSAMWTSCGPCCSISRAYRQRQLLSSMRVTESFHWKSKSVDCNRVSYRRSHACRVRHNRVFNIFLTCVHVCALIGAHGNHCGLQRHAHVYVVDDVRLRCLKERTASFPRRKQIFIKIIFIRAFAAICASIWYVCLEFKDGLDVLVDSAILVLKRDNYGELVYVLWRHSVPRRDLQWPLYVVIIYSIG